MLVGCDKLYLPVETYSKKLIYLMETYLNIIDIKSDEISKKANEKAKIVIRASIFKNKEFIKDYKNIENSIGKKTRLIISKYTTSIMQILGRVAECLLIDECTKNATNNMICMNIALLKEDIFNEYSGEEYEKYIPFSPSFKYIIKETNGIIQRYNVSDYNPQHTSKDIAWCMKDNILTQKKVNLNNIGYFENAKLQVKTSLNYNNVSITPQYYLTPIVYFDLNNDINNLKQKYPNHFIVSAREINLNMMNQMEIYFKIIASFATGLIDRINITNNDIYENNMLTYLFRSNINNLTNEGYYNNAITSMIAEAKNYSKPIEIGT